MHILIKVSLFAFIVSFILAWLLIKLKHPDLLLDHPNSRKIHHKPVPLIGGFVIVITLLITGSVFQLINDQTMLKLLLIGLLFFIIGLLDDLYDWSFKTKLIFQLSGVMLFIFTMPINVNTIILTNIELQNPFLNIILLILWILGIINAFNFFDGINLLAGSIAIVIFTSFSLLLSDFNYNSISIIYPILIFSIFSFLYFNSHPSKMFLGDSGSYFIGFMIAALPIIHICKSANITDMTIPFIITSILLLETFCLIIKRILKNNSPFKPDNNHLHHILIQFNMRQRYVIGIIILFFIGSCFFAIYSSVIQFHHLILFELFIFSTLIIGPRVLLYKINKS